MSALVELASAGNRGRVFIDPAAVVAVGEKMHAEGVSYVELTSGNTLAVDGQVEAVLETLGRDR